MVCLLRLVLQFTILILVFIGVLFTSVNLHDSVLSKAIGTECFRASQFRCLNASCIAQESRCNGIVDCHDGSDETNCCTKDQFLCGSNICINKSKVCNGVDDCANNKDELKCQCVLPSMHPKNTKVFVFRDLLEVAPGTIFNINDIPIQYNCSEGYTEISELWRINYCKMGKHGTAEWEHNTFLGCSRTCTKIIFDSQWYKEWQPLKDINENWQMCRDENKKTINCRTEPHIFPGTIVPMVCSKDPSIISKIECDINGKWTGSLPKCHYPYHSYKLSDSINSDKTTCSTESLNKPSLKLIFSDNFTTVSATTGWGTLLVGTRVKIVCAKEYYSSVVVNTELMCTKNGEWTGGEIPKCKMVCGERSGRYMVPSMWNGVKTSTQVYPWVAAIYRKPPSNNNFAYICGGNIISPKLVISAAHCFCFMENSSYLIGVGKNFREFIQRYLHENVQMHTISEIKRLADYAGEQTYHENDIIAIVLKTIIRFDVHIKPVCIDYETESNEIKENLLELRNGYIAGWETLKNNKMSNQLTFTSQLIVEDCRSHLIKNGRLNDINYLTNDKFCAVNSRHSTVCLGDSGQGLVFEKLVNNRLRFYLYGVLSLTAKNCSAPSYGFYTNVQNFKEEIKTLMTEYDD